MSAFGGKAGSAAAIWPLAARAQQGERVRHIGVLMSLAADDKEGQARLAAFLQGLQELGWIDGRKGSILAGAREMASALANILPNSALTPDVILASGGSLVAPLLQATRTVPIVFTQTPVVEIKLGFDHRLLHSCFRDGVEDAYAPTSDSCEPGDNASGLRPTCLACTAGCFRLNRNPICDERHGPLLSQTARRGLPRLRLYRLVRANVCTGAYKTIGKCALSDKCVVKIAGAAMPLDPLSIGLIRNIRNENSKGSRPIRRPNIYRWLNRNLG